jgi:hypothetical protein
MAVLFGKINIYWKVLSNSLTMASMVFKNVAILD